MYVIQDLQAARSFAAKAFETNRNRSFSALFRRLRKRRDVSLVGDFVLMAIICEEADKMQIVASDNQLLRMSSNSQEYKAMTKRQKMVWNRSLKKYFN